MREAIYWPPGAPAEGDGLSDANAALDRFKPRVAAGR